MGEASGFEFSVRADGTVVITHHGRRATVLRGARAEEFLDDAADDPQGAMARWRDGRGTIGAGTSASRSSIRAIGGAGDSPRPSRDGPEPSGRRVDAAPGVAERRPWSHRILLP